MTREIRENKTLAKITAYKYSISHIYQNGITGFAMKLSVALQIILIHVHVMNGQTWQTIILLICVVNLRLTPSKFLMIIIFYLQNTALGLG